tara:strand:- start:13 stop:201 length:189 start_codon:yes stop_codon:yes gene_type:complete
MILLHNKYIEFSTYLFEMKRKKRNNEIEPDPYENVVRLHKLDPYEALIKSNIVLKKNNKSIE